MFEFTAKCSFFNIPKKNTKFCNTKKVLVRLDISLLDIFRYITQYHLHCNHTFLKTHIC